MAIQKTGTALDEFAFARSHQRTKAWLQHAERLSESRDEIFQTCAQEILRLQNAMRHLAIVQSAILNVHSIGQQIDTPSVREVTLEEGVVEMPNYLVQILVKEYRTKCEELVAEHQIARANPLYTELPHFGECYGITLGTVAHIIPELHGKVAANNPIMQFDKRGNPAKQTEQIINRFLETKPEQPLA